MEFLLKCAKNVDAIFLALILNMNCLRLFLPVNDTLFYSLYILFIGIAYFANDWSSAKSHANNNDLLILFLLFFIDSVSGMFLQSSYMMEFKFIISFVIAYFAYCFTLKKILLTFKIVILINVIYAFVLLFIGSKVYVYMSLAKMTYLNVTLSLGLTCSLLFCTIIFGQYGIVPKKNILVSIVLIVVSFLAMILFNGRGNVLFPIVVLMLLIVFYSSKNPLKALFVLVPVAIMLYVSYEYYMQYEDSYKVNRMLRMFEDVESESRLGLWTHYIETIFNDVVFLFGGGGDYSRNEFGYYPHNIYLQLLGEFGLVGLVMGIYISVKCFVIMILGRRFLNPEIACLDNTKFIVQPFFYSAAFFFYYWLTFLKSFSFFDAYPLFISIAFLLRLRQYIPQKTSQGLLFNSKYSFIIK